jgi:hypothetical protein
MRNSRQAIEPDAVLNSCIDYTSSPDLWPFTKSEELQVESLADKAEGFIPMGTRAGGVLGSFFMSDKMPSVWFGFSQPADEKYRSAS